MEPFQAFRIHRDDGKVQGRLETITLDDLCDGEVVIRARFSSINYKDALAATGAGRILKTFPLVGGVDVAGEVESSADGRLARGDQVLVTGCGLSETTDGGYARFVEIDGDSVIPIPEGLDCRSAMALGTAGFTAGLAIHRMEHNGQRPDMGPIAVTGASGGVGSLAVNMLSGLGYEVAAVTGKSDARSFLERLGAKRVLDRIQIDLGARPLEKSMWGGAIDNVGGEILTWLTRTVGFWGNIASIGLAGSADLNTTVMPFILRGVNLLGINSVATPRESRLQIWNRLATDLKPKDLDLIANRTVELMDLPDSFESYLKGTIQGRTVVRIP